MALAFVAMLLIGAGSSEAVSKLIDGKRIKKHSVPLNALSNGAVNGLKGARGQAGQPGPAGAPGPAGGPGPITYVQGPQTPLGDVEYSIASCPAGTIVIAGGYLTTTSQTFIYQNQPSGDHSAWIAGAANYGSFSGYIQAYAECTSSTAVSALTRSQASPATAVHEAEAAAATIGRQVASP